MKFLRASCRHVIRLECFTTRCALCALKVFTFSSSQTDQTRLTDRRTELIQRFLVARDTFVSVDNDCSHPTDVVVYVCRERKIARNGSVGKLDENLVSDRIPTRYYFLNTWPTIETIFVSLRCRRLKTQENRFVVFKRP